MLYPLKFKSIYKEKVWGGDKIRKLKSDNSTPLNCGESWEISAIQNDISVVENGFLNNNSLEEIIEIYMGEIVGDSVFDKFGYEFPILLKIIEAKENLSIQVHPNDKIAEERHHARGKSEMWYVIESEEDARLISGFKNQTNFKELTDAINSGNIDELINQPIIKNSEVYYIPAGRIHSLGKGNIIVEVQQTSDVTYRLYDYNRLDRELHLELAKDVVDFNPIEKLTETFDRTPDKSNKIIKTDNFTVNFLPIMNSLEKDYFKLDSFVIYFCLKGELIIKYKNKTETISTGETVLIPAQLKNIVLIPKQYTEMLEVYMEL